MLEGVNTFVNTCGKIIDVVAYFITHYTIVCHLRPLKLFDENDGTVNCCYILTRDGEILIRCKLIEYIQFRIKI